MPNYPEYDWISKSIDATKVEIEKTNALTEAIKKQCQKDIIFFQNL